MADFNSTTDGVVQPKGLGSIILGDDLKNTNQKNDELTITELRENKHSSQRQESCIDQKINIESNENTSAKPSLAEESKKIMVYSRSKQNISKQIE